MPSNLPTVSIVIPAKEAAAHLPEALEAIAGQTYPNILEVIVAAADPDSAEAADGLAVVVENLSGRTPTGLNMAIEASGGEVIVRCDAQSILPPDYVARAVETLQRTGADNVGGMQRPAGRTPWEKAIAAAMVSRFGAGDARYRLGGEEGPVETVYLGVFRREALKRVGGFDPEFIRTQDYELNHRIIDSGGVVWFDPSLVVEYRPRGNLRGLWNQYFAYGRAKRQFARKHPNSLQPRQIAAPLLVLGMAICLAVAPWAPYALLVPVGYILAISAVGLGHGSLRVSAALATMHISWGLGFLTMGKEPRS